MTVSCITGSRIRIAAFELGAGTLDSRGEMEAFEEFIYRNDGKIVRMDVAFDKGMILHEEKNDLVQLTIGIEDPDQTCGGVTCGGTEYNIIVEPDDRDHGSPINFANGIYYVKGFFMPEGISGMHQGWLSTALRYVPDEHIILSDRYIVP